MDNYQLSPRHTLCHLLTAAALSAALAGCASWWDIGPEPSDFVGRGNSEKLITDPQLQAITPRVAGDNPDGGVTFPTATSPASAPATAPVIAPASAADAPESLSVQDAILNGLENNVSLRVQRLNVPISRTAEEQSKTGIAAFDPTVSGSIQGGRSVGGGNIIDSIAATATVTEFLPTGTTIQGQLTTSNKFYSESALSQGASLSVTQSLLRGAGLDVNLAGLRESELSTKITQYELRGVAETLVANIESAYWDLAFAERQVGIVQNSLDVAQQQLENTTARVKAERLSPTELPAAQSQVAIQRENLITARSTLETARLKFLQLLTPANRDFWRRSVILTTLPFIPQGTMDPVESHLDAAMRFRPDLNQALLQLQRGDLEIVRTKNGLLPRLDLFVNLGKSGFSAGYGESILKTFDGTDYQALVGVSGDWEPLNRAAKASYRAAELTREQLLGTLDNQRQLAQFDVRNQYGIVISSRLQIDATRATREAQQATVDVQKGKLDAGSGTSLDWAIAQNALLNAQLSEVQAVTNHLKNLVQLYLLEGTLLLRRGLDAPGATPVEGPVFK